MKISLNWLKRYIDIDVSLQELADKLTMSGLEVESIEEIGAELKDFVIAEVLEVAKHPNADKLTICKVNDGKTVHQIVCGAPNVKAGQKVVLGLSGTIIPRDQHSAEGKPFKLAKVKIRGVESNGMLCSEFELGIGDDKDGILILDENSPIGKNFIEYLNISDSVFEIGITPNRPDALSHIGVARDIAAIFKKSVNKPEYKLIESAELAKDSASIEIIDIEGCPRYCARIIKNVKIGPSPEWMQKYIKAIGLRPISNIVDITNFVLHECGHPLHAFDYDLLKGHKIIVRKSRTGEKFTTLDGKEHELNDDTVLICDSEKPVALGGVMGGLNSEINSNTKNVLLESAYFNPKCIRRASKILGISTDASYRMERGTDPNGLLYSLDRATALIQEIAGGEVLKGVIDIYPKKIENQVVSIRISRTGFILGKEIPGNTIIEILTNLGMKLIKNEGDILTFDVPTYRPDIEREIDLIEEVARIYGYNNISDKMESELKFMIDPLELDLENEIRNYLSGQGFNEIITNSLLERAEAELFSKSIVEIINPISQTMTSLRPSLIPGALQTIKRNINIGERDLRLFEIGNIFSIDEKGTYFKGYSEKTSLLLAITGNSLPLSWNIKNREVDFFDLKGEVESLLKKIFLESFKLISYSTDKYILTLEISGVKAGSLMEINKELLDKYDIGQNVYICEIFIEHLKKNIKRGKKFIALGKFPPVKRDLAFIVDQDIKIEDIKTNIKKSGGINLYKIELFDIFSGGKLGKGKKNVAFSLEFVSKDHNLTSDEIDIEIHGIVKNLEEKYKAVLREF